MVQSADPSEIYLCKDLVDSDVKYARLQTYNTPYYCNQRRHTGHRNSGRTD